MKTVTSSGRKPLVSIVIPVYNMEKYLQECLESVLGQTLKEIEVICVNDGSTDSSLAILKRYSARDPRITLMDQPNGGVSAARNAALSRVRGKYTFFADADDCLEPTLCSKAFCAAEHIQAEVCFHFVKTDDGAAIDSLDVQLAMASPVQEGREYLLTRVNGGPWTKLFLTRFLLENAIKFPPYRIGEDQLVHWQACLLSKRIAICPEQLYRYRQNPASAMNSGGEKCLDVIGVFATIKEFLINHGLYEPYRDTFLAMKLDHLYLECHALAPPLHLLRQQRLQATLGTDEIAWLKSDQAPVFFRHFFLSMCGVRTAGFSHGIFVMKRKAMKAFGLDRLKARIRASLVRKFSLTTRDSSLCDSVAQLRSEIVQNDQGRSDGK